TAAHVAEGTRITVRRGDTMFAIAQRNAVPGVTVYQMMIALQRANTQAFIEDNVNLVKVGATLTMPGMDALTALSDREARRIFQQHAQAFARYRQRSGGADVAAVSTTGAAAAQGDVSPAPALASSPSSESRPSAGDRLRLSAANGPDAIVVPGSTGSSDGAGASGGSASARGRSPGEPLSLLASSGAIASDAVSQRAPDASSSDASGAAAVGVSASGALQSDDEAATRKGMQESQTRILELEDNVRHLNEALQKQGHVAAETALEGLNSVSEAIK